MKSTPESCGEKRRTEGNEIICCCCCCVCFNIKLRKHFSFSVVFLKTNSSFGLLVNHVIFGEAWHTNKPCSVDICVITFGCEPSFIAKDENFLEGLLGKALFKANHEFDRKSRCQL